jgi:hypothetical protein
VFLSVRTAWRLRQRLFGAALPLLLLSGACTVTVENDDSSWGGNGDRWYTGGVRGQRDVTGEPDCVDVLALDVAEQLAFLRTDAAEDRQHFTTVASVAGLEAYTPQDIDTSAPVLDDRPYAGWLYAGVVRYDTQLDPDTLARRDEETQVELDVGIVGPASQAEWAQDTLHEVFGLSEAEGWDHQLENELGVVLRGRRSVRAAYDELDPAEGLAFDALRRVGGAVGNVDTHAAVGGSLRLGYELPRSFDVAGGDRSRLLPGRARTGQEPASLFGYVDLEGRLVLRNIFLDGNTFRDSQDVDKQEVVGTLRVGVAWEWGAWRLGYGWTRRTDEFDSQPEDQSYGSFVVSWTPAG